MPLHMETNLNTEQRDLLAKTLADVAKGISIATLIALATNKIALGWTLIAIASALQCYVIAHNLLSGASQ